MRLVLSLLLTLPAVLPISQDRKGASPASDRAVVEAIWRDVVVKRMTADYRADAQESEQLRAQLLSETLVVCDTRRRPCISPPVVEIARLSAAAAKWSPGLSSDLARLTQPLRLTGIDVQGVTLADRREGKELPHGRQCASIFRQRGARLSTMRKTNEYLVVACPLTAVSSHDLGRGVRSRYLHRRFLSSWTAWQRSCEDVLRRRTA